MEDVEVADRGAPGAGAGEIDGAVGADRADNAQPLGFERPAAADAVAESEAIGDISGAGLEGTQVLEGLAGDAEADQGIGDRTGVGFRVAAPRVLSEAPDQLDLLFAGGAERLAELGGESILEQGSGAQHPCAGADLEAEMGGERELLGIGGAKLVREPASRLFPIGERHLARRTPSETASSP